MSDGWLSAARLAGRTAAASGPLAPLADSLARDLEPVLAAELALPPEKARLSRAGGRCPRDGAMLRFDPFSPRAHACPACGATYDGEAHYRWWIMGYHLWLAERAVHAAALHGVRGDARHAAFAADVLARCTHAYLRWPNVDNVLGPTRPFFSTYLESIWLLQLCVALELLETSAPGVMDGGLVRDRLVEPSARLIAGFDEGMSNRQVWNGAALLAAARLLGDGALAERAVHSVSGLHAHLRGALLADGTWYEGENYHLFAHRGLWYGVHLAEAAGQGPLPAALARRFDEGFATPFLTALPDLTFPARRDSQYAVSLRQWRFAELAELGLARRPDDARLSGALARLYDGDAPARDTGRRRSTAEAERNEPAAALTRADLGWRSLLFARPELPPLRHHAPASVLLPAQGLAVLRRDAGRVYAALDYGVAGGGHGHPDRLGVLLSVGGERWLDDPGTGSYVDPSLHWYRSTLAHNAPLVDGRSQPSLDGRLLAWDERGGAGWVRAGVSVPPSGVALRRTLVVMTDYVVDELHWTGGAPVEVALPMHVDAALDGVDGWAPAAPALDGADHLEDVERAPAAAGAARLVGPDGAVRAWVLVDGDATWWRATRPGAPGRPRGPVHVVARTAPAGRIATVWSWRGLVLDVARTEAGLEIRGADGSRHLHAETDAGWHVDLGIRGAASSIDLGGLVPASADADAPSGAEPASRGPLPAADAPLHACLAEAQYRRSEVAWREAGAPTAAVSLHADGDALHVRVHVRKPALALVPPGAVNDMDNERAEIHGDGVQVHVAAAPRGGAAWPVETWLFVPRGDGGVRVLPPAAAPPGGARATWRAEPDGWSLDAVVPLAPVRSRAAAPRRLGLDVVVNEGAPGRERRQGQLALGGGGDTVYLQGDRRDARHLLWFDDPDV